MSKLRLGLIGVGGIMNGTHIPGYLTCDDCEIVAICDINPETLKKVGEKLNIPEENRFLHHEDMMKSGLVDIVDIATPDNMHCPIATDAVKYNLPFSVEKPMGMNYKEVKKVCARPCLLLLALFPLYPPDARKTGHRHAGQDLSYLYPLHPQQRHVGRPPSGMAF